MLNWPVILVKAFCAFGISAIGVLTGAMAQNGSIVMPTAAVWVLAALAGAGTGLLTLQSAVNDAPLKKEVLKALVLCVVGVGLLAGCANKPGDLKLDEVTLTNNAVAAAGEQAKDTNAIYVRLCDAKVLTVKECDEWREFYERFKLIYPPAARSYQKAVARGDDGSAATSVREIRALSNELAIYFLTVRGK